MIPSQPIFWLVHGWGSSVGFWRPLMAVLPPWPVVRADMGYFGQPSFLTPPEQPFIAVGHSLGFLHLLHQLADNNSQCLGLVGINSFSRFSRCNDFPNGIHTRVLQRMISRMAQSPAEVLMDFGSRSGWNSPVGLAADFQVDPLVNGLRFLQNGDGRAALSHWTLPLLILAAKDDQIVPPALTEDSFAGRHDVQWRDGGGHLLPLFQAGWCGERIGQWVNSIL